MQFEWEEMKTEKLKPISPYRKKIKHIFFERQNFVFGRIF